MSNVLYVKKMLQMAPHKFNKIMLVYKIDLIFVLPISKTRVLFTTSIIYLVNVATCPASMFKILPVNFSEESRQK